MNRFLSWTIAGAVLVCAAAGAYLWVAPFSAPASHSLYACSNDTYVRTTIRGDSTRLRVTLPEGGPVQLNRVPAPLGALYRTPSRDIEFWTRDSSAVAYRAGRPVLWGCIAVTDSADAPNADAHRPWFRSPPTPGGHVVFFRHRRGVEISMPGPRRVRLLYAGPANEPPALTDGFTVTIGVAELSKGTTLREHVKAKIASTERAGGAVLRPPRDTTVRGRPAVTWRQETLLGGAATHWTVRLDAQSAATISTSTVGAKTTPYKRRIRALRRSLRFRTRSAPPADTASVPLAMLADPDDSPERGCDDVVFVEHRIPAGADSLTAALDTLFSIDRDSVGGARHFLQQTNETLRFDRAVVRDDTAHVYLTGRLTGLRGVCDNPRTRIQIEETVRRVTGVKEVVLFLNGRRTSLHPTGKGMRGGSPAP